MITLRCNRILLLSFLPLILCSCSTTYKDVYPTLIDGKYDTEFPYRGCSQQLEEIAETVKMISSIAYYRSYSFNLEDRIKLSDVTDELRKKYEDRAIYVNNSASGTATVISYERRHAALITCAHVVAFPDTLVSYHIGPDRRSTGYVNTFSLKIRQTNYVGAFPEGGELEILCIDKSRDIAILGKLFSLEPSRRIAAFNYPLGKAKELEWGSFVYLFGYPAGYKIVTKGIVSSPNKDKSGSFLVDAVFTRGFSGGIVLAIRDGVPNFELVGLVKLISGRSSYVLSPPEEDASVEYDPTIPYTGSIYVQRRVDIQYGITQAVSIDAIREFIQERKEELVQKGYYLRAFFEPSDMEKPR